MQIASIRSPPNKSHPVQVICLTEVLGAENQGAVNFSRSRIKKVSRRISETYMSLSLLRIRLLLSTQLPAGLNGSTYSRISCLKRMQRAGMPAFGSSRPRSRSFAASSATIGAVGRAGPPRGCAVASYGYVIRCAWIGRGGACEPYRRIVEG